MMARSKTPSARSFSHHRPTEGRSATRSRLGCATCKRRHVRCDQAHPSCETCCRLQLQCYYPHRSQRTPELAKQRMLLPSPSISGTSLEENDHVDQFESPSWSNNRTSTDIDALCSSWAGELEPFGNTISSLSNMSPSNSNSDATTDARATIASQLSDPGGYSHAATLWRAGLSNPDVSITISPQTEDYFHLDVLLSSEPKHPLKVFGNIMQPPAAMLMGGIKKWRYLQDYLVDLASRNDAVMSALSALDKLLEWDSIGDTITPKHHLELYIQNSFTTTVFMIQQDVSLIQSGSSSKMDNWLAAIFLLAWIHVLQDRVENDKDSLFPTELADTIITCPYDWNWYSRQLLSWFNSLDSKASHLSGPTLLSSKALQVVSQYPIQIISCDYEESKHRRDSFDSERDFRLLSQSPMSSVSGHGDNDIVVPARNPCDVKEIILRAILQSAAEWYLKTQACCRQISALDKHHCERFTPDAEMKVALEGKKIYCKLWDLWAQCPAVISLSTVELSMTVAPDVATRLQEVFSVYLASFWILFVYLHRVCWWHLPHTEVVADALESVWDHMQRSYGEADDKNQQKTVHPALMWPVFLFGAECKADERRIWAVQQLQALGRSRPVLKSENQNNSPETLPAFRISHGATRNAKRAQVLLEALIHKQDEANCRVDDRDLAMDIFGCYFSIV